jgi:hypothetical protein
MSEILNCNTNVQIGDPTQVLYSTLYSSKSTQKEDAEKKQRIASSIIRRLLREEQKVMRGERDMMPSGFGEGISLLLSGITAATSRDVRSAPMAHLLVCQNGMRFMYSHGFCPLLVSHMEDTLENNPVNVKLRRSKKGKDTVVWADSSSEDYLHRPSSEQFNTMSFYEMTMNYKKNPNCWKHFFAHEDIDDDKDDDNDDPMNLSEVELISEVEEKIKFQESHPGYDFCHLVKLNKMVIPKVFYAREKLCSIDELKIGHQDNNNDHLSRLRENYARIALILFYPFRSMDDIKLNGSHWALFERELTLKKSGQPTTFWDYGFEILQNIQDRKALEHCDKRAVDQLTKSTVLQDPIEVEKATKTRKKKSSKLPDLFEMVVSAG